MLARLRNWFNWETADFLQIKDISVDHQLKLQLQFCTDIHSLSCSFFIHLSLTLTFANPLFPPREQQARRSVTDGTASSTPLHTHTGLSPAPLYCGRSLTFCLIRALLITTASSRSERETYRHTQRERQVTLREWLWVLKGLSSDNRGRDCIHHQRVSAQLP